MGEKQHLVPGAARHYALRVAEGSWGERTVDHDFISARPQTGQLAMAQAKAPLTVVVAGPIGDPVLVRRDGVQPGLELLEPKGGTHWLGVIEDMQIVGLEIHYPATVRVCHPGILDIPFERHFPVEYLGAAGHLVPVKFNATIDQPQRLAYAGTGNAAADRIQLGGKCLQCGAGGQGGGPHAGTAVRSSSRSKCSRSKSG